MSCVIPDFSVDFDFHLGTPFFSFFCLPDFIGADALVRKTSNFAFPPPSVIQAVSAIAVLKGVALEFVVYSFHSVLLTVPSSHG